MQLKCFRLCPSEPLQSRAALTLAALGVVYGDIGTSPLYAVKETFNPAHGIPLAPENILGGISAIYWALMVVVSRKYVILIMRANNKGEGGIMALRAVAHLIPLHVETMPHQEEAVWRSGTTTVCTEGAIS
ncbi:KUP/HAK/KT family potassium transporter [Cupriavidus necator]|uniref:KUP/HAK/KT family potassium transporter n=1 Tax=Cupriavidus necator TaxID=106590 RepID=UPI000B1CB40C|nr:KUP/HAK/KT family potassium transporter [Cupriavidus necator]